MANSCQHSRCANPRLARPKPAFYPRTDFRIGAGATVSYPQIIAALKDPGVTSPPHGDVDPRAGRYLHCSCSLYFFLFVCPLPDRDPDRRLPELPRACFFDPVPDAPGRLPLFFFPFAARLASTLRAPGASFFGPLPRRLASGPGVPIVACSSATSPVLSAVVRAPRLDAVPRARPPLPPPPPPIVVSAASRRRLVADLLPLRAIELPPVANSPQTPFHPPAGICFASQANRRVCRWHQIGLAIMSCPA